MIPNPMSLSFQPVDDGIGNMHSSSSDKIVEFQLGLGKMVDPFLQSLL
jgi:hypothetical protein